MKNWEKNLVQLVQQNQKITDAELEKLTDLNLDNSNITDLSGIEAAKNLQTSR